MQLFSWAPYHPSIRCDAIRVDHRRPQCRTISSHRPNPWIVVVVVVVVASVACWRAHWIAWFDSITIIVAVAPSPHRRTIIRPPPPYWKTTFYLKYKKGLRTKGKRKKRANKLTAAADVLYSILCVPYYTEKESNSVEHASTNAIVCGCS